MIKTIFIGGMHCQHCVQAVNDALKALPGITSVTVSLEDNVATVSGPAPDEAAIKAAIAATGFDVIEIAYAHANKKLPAY